MYRSPLRVIGPSLVLPPMLQYRGTIPSQGANCRPLRNSWACPTVAIAASAVIGPTTRGRNQLLGALVEARHGFELPIIFSNARLEQSPRAHADPLTPAWPVAVDAPAPQPSHAGVDSPSAAPHRT